MAIHDQQDGQEPSLPALSAKGASRRRFAKAGVGASGVLLTLASKSALANPPLICTAPSGFQSFQVGTSLHHQTNPCAGRTPGYWQADVANWSVTGISKTDKFKKYFPGLDAVYGNVTMGDIENGYTGASFHDNQLGRHIAAALLNYKAHFTAMPTPALLSQIWAQYSTSGYFSSGAYMDGRYEVSAGVFWDAAQIVTYLQASMDV